MLILFVSWKAKKDLYDKTLKTSHPKHIQPPTLKTQNCKIACYEKSILPKIIACETNYKTFFKDFAF